MLTAFLAPAREAVEYEERLFDAAFFTKGNAYKGFPTNETDQLWEELYNNRK